MVVDGLYSTSLFGGVTAVNAVLTAWVIFAVTMPSPSSTVLGSVPLRTLGGLGYAAYLVHWPLFLLLDEDRLGFGGPLLFLRTAGGHAGGRGRGHLRPRASPPPGPPPGPRLAVALGLVLVVVGAAPSSCRSSHPRRQPSPSTTEADRATSTSSSRRATRPCRSRSSAARWPGSLNPGFEAWNAAAPDQGVRIATRGHRLPAVGPRARATGGRRRGRGHRVRGLRPPPAAPARRAAPDVVVVIPGVGDLGEREIDRQWVRAGDQVFDTWLRQHLDDLADTLGEAGVPSWATSPHVRLAPAR